MQFVITIALVAILKSVVCEDVVQKEIVAKPEPVGVIYLFQPLYQKEIKKSENEDNINNIPSDNLYKKSNLYASLTPDNVKQDKDINRAKRSPGYGKGGGGVCNVCGGGGGHGGYPGGGGYGGGGGHGSSGSWSQASASSGSWGSGGGYGKGKFGK